MSNEENKEKSFMITVMGSIEVFGDETVEQAIAWVRENLTIDLGINLDNFSTHNDFEKLDLIYRFFAWSQVLD